LIPAEPKSTSALAFSPAPEVATTLPIPNTECSTRSPASRCGISFFFGKGVPKLTVLRHWVVALSLARSRSYEVAEVERQLVTADSVRRQSIRSSGISARNRLGGLCWGAPQADRTIARLR